MKRSSISIDTVYFNHRHGCQNCTVVGEYKKRRMSFLKTNCNPRTDYSFRNREDPRHHRGVSLIESLPVDMIADFIIADPLHLLELGIMKKLLLIWVTGKVEQDLKLPKNDRTTLDSALIQCNKYKPTEIHRKIRSLDWLKFWKGSEFRTVLLYVGIVALRNILGSDVYTHFLYLFCAVTICSAHAYRNYVPKAKTLFEEYVEMYISIYGSHSITSNVHNLLHVTDNVQRFGNLNSISTYPFENAARFIKLKLKQCDKSLEQVSRRILELMEIKLISPVVLKEKYILKFPIESGSDLTYEYICIDNSIIFSSRKEGDRC